MRTKIFKGVFIIQEYRIIISNNNPNQKMQNLNNEYEMLLEIWNTFFCNPHIKESVKYCEFLESLMQDQLIKITYYLNELAKGEAACDLNFEIIRDNTEESN